MFESYLINFSWKFNLKVTFKRVRLNFIIIDIVFKYFFFLDIPPSLYIKIIYFNYFFIKYLHYMVKLISLVLTLFLSTVKF